MRRQLCFVTTLAVGAFPCIASAIGIDFELMRWTDAQARALLSSAVGVKPTSPLPVVGDWLVFSPDDEQLSGGFNPAGALSHNLADLSGTGGAGFNQAPSLTGSLTIEFASAGGQTWNTVATGLAYIGQATPVMQMNQFLVAPGSAPTQNSQFGVDGLDNSGAWQASAANNWQFNQTLDFYFATNADGDPNPADVDVTFDDKLQAGYLIPVTELTPSGMAAVILDDPAGTFGGDFEQYLLDEIAPRLPVEATYLLVTQMDKAHPDYAEAGLPITVNSFIGNTTFAFTTQSIPEPTTAALLGIAAAAWIRRRRYFGVGA